MVTSEWLRNHRSDGNRGVRLPDGDAPGFSVTLGDRDGQPVFVVDGPVSACTAGVLATVLAACDPGSGGVVLDLSAVSDLGPDAIAMLAAEHARLSDSGRHLLVVPPVIDLRPGTVFPHPTGTNPTGVSDQHTAAGATPTGSATAPSPARRSPRRPAAQRPVARARGVHSRDA